MCALFSKKVDGSCLILQHSRVYFIHHAHHHYLFFGCWYKREFKRGCDGKIMERVHHGGVLVAADSEWERHTWTTRTVRSN